MHINKHTLRFIILQVRSKMEEIWKLLFSFHCGFERAHSFEVIKSRSLCVSSHDLSYNSRWIHVFSTIARSLQSFVEFVLRVLNNYKAGSPFCGFSENVIELWVHVPYLDLNHFTCWHTIPHPQKQTDWKFPVTSKASRSFYIAIRNACEWVFYASWCQFTSSSLQRLRWMTLTCKVILLL